MQRSIATLILMLGATAAVRAQAIPAGTAAEPSYNPGPALPVIDGNFQYALSVGEVAQSGYSGNQDWTYTTNLSGDVEYIGRSTVHPFSMLYSGGLLLSTYSGSQTGFFQNLTVSQGLVGHGWAVGASDSISYLPQSPTTGLSGIPGVGDLGLQPVADPNAPAQSVLTNYGKRISNLVSGNIERELNARTSISGSASYGILRFLGASGSGGASTAGLDSNQIGGNVALNRRLNVRTNASVSGYYNQYSYLGASSSFNSKGINLSFSRQMTKSVGLSVSAGPQITSGFTALGAQGGGTLPAPGTVNVSVSAGLTYAHKFTSGTLSYFRGVNGGSGVQTGGQSDGVNGGIHQTFQRDWSIGLTSSYTRTTGLAATGTTESVYGGAQVSRRFLSSFSGYLSYTGIHQSTSTTLVGRNAFNGFSQAVAAGITFSPKSSRLGQF